MYEIEAVEIEAIAPEALTALQAGLRFRLVPSSAVALTVPPDLMDHAQEGWPRFVLAGRFAEGEPGGHTGVWCTGDCSVDDDRAASLAPVLPVNTAARRWSIWGADVDPTDRLRRTVDRVVGSGLVTFAVETSMASQVQHE